MARLTIKKFFGSAPNDLLNNPNVSFKAKGLYAFMNSKPEDWDFSVQSIATQNKEGRDSISAAIKELESTGYLTRKKHKDALGQFHIEYILLETPDFGKPDDGKPDDGNSDDGKHPQQYKKDHTKKENTKKEDNTSKHDFGEWSEAMRVWINYRKNIRKPFRTDRGINSALSDLKKACKDDVNMAMPVVEYCMNKEWQAIYAVKEQLSVVAPTTGLHVNNEDYKLGKIRYKRQHEFALYADYVKHCKQYGHTIKPEGHNYEA